MPADVLTDAQIKRLAPREKPYKVFDGGGLFLYVSPTAKLWRVAYRLDGKQQTRSLGKYPLVTLAEARKLRDEAKRLLQAGETLKPKSVAIKPTLARVSAEYWASRQDLSADYRQNAVSALARYVLPRLGERPTISTPWPHERGDNYLDARRHFPLHCYDAVLKSAKMETYEKANLYRCLRARCGRRIGSKQPTGIRITTVRLEPRAIVRLG